MLHPRFKAAFLLPCVLSSICAARDFEFRTVALSGRTAPGAGASAFKSFGVPSLNNEGQIAFLGGLGLSNPDFANHGVWRESGAGNVQPLVISTLYAGNNFVTTNGLTFDTIATQPVIGSDGAVAFGAVGEPVPYGPTISGVYLATPTAITPIVQHGDTYAGTSIGGSFTPYVVHAGGAVTFEGVNSIAHRSANGNTYLLARYGHAVPGITSATYDQTTLSDVRVNTSGQMAFSARIDSPVNNQDLVIMGGTVAAPQPIVYDMMPVPGVTNHVFNLQNENRTYSINNNGQVAFSTFWQKTTDVVPTNAGIWTGTPGNISLALGRGTLPGYSAHSMRTFSETLINDNNDIVARTAGNTFEGALIRRHNGVWSTLLLDGEAVPGISDATFQVNIVPPEFAMNAAGEVLVLADLNGSSARNRALLYVGLDGIAQVLLRKGDLYNVGTDAIPDYRTIQSLSFLAPASTSIAGSGFNDNGDIAARLVFTDGSVGIFTTAVPEPAVGAAILVLAFGLSRRRTPR